MFQSSSDSSKDVQTGYKASENIDRLFVIREETCSNYVL